MANLGRLSLAVHKDYAVGASPEHVTDPYNYREGDNRSHLSEEEQKKQTNDAHHLDQESRGVSVHSNHDFWQGDRGNEHRELKENEKPRPPSPDHLVRQHLTSQYYEEHQHEDKMTDSKAGLAVRKQTLKQVRGEQGPDFTGKNYAAIGVVDSHGNTRYVVDSSLPPGNELRRDRGGGQPWQHPVRRGQFTAARQAGDDAGALRAPSGPLDRSSVLEGVRDAYDLQESLMGWIRTIDPAVADQDFWEHEFAGFFDSDYV